MKKKNTTSDPKKWLKISIQTPTRLVESVSDLLGVLSGSGVEFTPEKDKKSIISTFFAIKEGIDNCSEITEQISEKIKNLFHIYDIPMPEIMTEVIDDQDWATSWKQFFTPMEIVPGFIIKPSWEEYQPTRNEKVIEMDPGQAFGTGQHASTRMALSLLANSMKKESKERVLDVGTGTGILAMAAILFGAESVIAIDNDPEAVRVAEENIAINGLSDHISINLTDLADVQGPFTLILANIVHDVLIEMAPLFGRLLAPGGELILAGLLCGKQEDNIIQVNKQLGLDLQKNLHDQEWAALQLRKN